MGSVEYNRQQIDDSIMELESANTKLAEISSELDNAVSRLLGAKGIEYLDTSAVTNCTEDVATGSSMTDSLVGKIRENQSIIEEYNAGDKTLLGQFIKAVSDMTNLVYEYAEKEKLMIYYYKDKSGHINPFYITDTKRNPIEYAENRASNICQENGFCQGKCLDLSFYYIMEMMSNHEYKNSTIKGLKESPEKKISNRVATIEEDGPAKIYEFIFNELNEGHPVGVQVTGSSATKRHWVTVVGYSCDVESSDQLNAENIFVIDCYSGEVGTLSDFNRDLFAWSSSKDKKKVFQACAPSDNYLKTDRFIHNAKEEPK